MGIRFFLAQGLCLSLCAASPALAEETDLSSGAHDKPRANDIIEARCTSCHGPAFVLAFSQRVVDSGGSGALDDFLAEHHATDPETRAAILEYILQQVANQKQP